MPDKTLTADEMEAFEKHRRSDDGREELFRITRELPLPWVIGVVLVVAGQAIALYYQQQNLATQLSAQTAEIKGLSVKVDRLVDQRNDDSIKNIQRDNLIERNRDRLDMLEKAITAGALSGPLLKR